MNSNPTANPVTGVMTPPVITTSIVSTIRDELGLALVSRGLVSTQTVEMAVKAREGQAANGGVRRSLASVLVEDFQVAHDTVYSILAEVYGFRTVDLSANPPDDAHMEHIRKLVEPLSASTKDYLVNLKMVPLRQDPSTSNKMLIVAANPTDKMIPVVARALRLQTYDVCYARIGEIESLLKKLFPPQNQYLLDLEKSDLSVIASESGEDEFDEALIEAEVNKSLLVNLAEGMLVEAVHQGASDIHIIPTGTMTTEILFRVDGMLKPWHRQDGIRPEAIAAVMKDRARNVDRFERETAQDGFIQRKIDGTHIRFRFSAMPIVGREYQYKFESIVIRVIDDRNVIADFEKLGLPPLARELFVRAISQPQGMVIVTGPTGSGKSFTLMAALNHITRPEINVLTVEDPVEFIIPGVRQLKISHKMTFEQALRSILRHDPDVVMMGEIRDKETCEMAIKLANTGHLTLSTLHTNDAPAAVSRMYKMGVETFLIAYAVNIVLAQRLMRKLCPRCRIPENNVDTKLALRLGFSNEEIKNHTFYDAVGCPFCNRGYKGRIAIHEALYFSKNIRRMIFEARENINEEDIRELAISEGMQTLQGAARDRVLAGLSTIEEYARVVSSD